jgi:rhamnosyltransferase
MYNIFSVIVLYNPTSDNLISLNRISQMSSSVIIIDNSETITNLEHFTRYENIIYVWNRINLGLAKALNIGIKKCLESNTCTHIALFDQDSNPDPMMFQNMWAYLKKTNVNLAAVGPRILDVKHPQKLNFNKAEIVDVLITSGTLFPKNIFEKVGLMDETLFIDYIDYEWCLRAKSKKYKIASVNDAFLYHNMGDSSINILGTFKPLHSSNIRFFYIIRNQLIFISRSYIPIKYRLIHFIKLFYRIPAYILLSKDKLTTCNLILKAFFDFFKNKTEYLEPKY